MSDHMKRLAAPRSWPLKRKENVFTTKQCPGSHSVEESVPAALMLRDILKVCDTSREAKRIVGNRDLLVDGKPVRSVKAPVGIMDVVAIPAMDQKTTDEHSVLKMTPSTSKVTAVTDSFLGAINEASARS